MSNPPSTSRFQDTVQASSSRARSDKRSLSWLRIILTWLAWNIVVGIGWALLPYIAAALAFAMEGNTTIVSAADRAAYLLARPSLFGSLAYPFAMLWLAIGILQIFCLAHPMRWVAWWRLRWLAITLYSGVGLSLFMSFALATASNFMFGIRFTVGYMVWSILTGVSQWLALDGRLRHLHRKFFLLWLGAHCLLPIFIARSLGYLASLLPQSLDTPVNDWPYVIGFVLVLGPGWLHSIVASGGLLLLLRRAQQQAWQQLYPHS
ncbi:MAG TPA: hypothetical protein VFO07_14160 [Roseiflexaceae bacterium]|nr:hypothetical protein [Roseiflexaceae bacterium]